jgi:hypothetical protein
MLMGSFHVPLVKRDLSARIIGSSACAFGMLLCAFMVFRAIPILWFNLLRVPHATRSPFLLNE